MHVLHHPVRARPDPLPPAGGDLRGGAALAIAALGAEGETIIEHAELIDRGYDHLEDMLCALGADAVRMEMNTQ